MPTLLHASMSSVPAGAVTFLPSTVMFTSGIKPSLVLGRRSFAKTGLWTNCQRPTTNDQRLICEITKLPDYQITKSETTPSPAPRPARTGTVFHPGDQI